MGEKLLIIVILLSLISIPHVNAQPVTENISVDAIAVYSKNVGAQTDIYYSFFGHRPKIPKPVNVSLDWKWWSLDGENVPSSQIPNPIAGFDQQPSVAFSREGNAVAVWESFRLNGTVTCEGGPSDVTTADILFSVWNGTGWSNASVAIAGANDTILQDPAFAIDSSGNGTVVYTKQVIPRNAGCPSDPIYSIEYARFHGPDTFSNGGTLDGPFANTPLGGSEVAFTSKLLAPNTFTRHQGVAAWWSNDTLYNKTCPGDPPNEIHIQTLWPKKAIWNGNSFDNIDFVPDKLVPPPDLTDNFSIVLGKKVGISSDQLNDAKVVWGIQKVSGNPCNFPNVSSETWSAQWNGTAWDMKAAMFDTLNIGPRGIDIAYLPNNEAISVYDSFDPFLIRWSVELPNGTWLNKGNLGSGGFDPTLASLAHNQTVALWVDGGKIMWSNITNGSWSQANVLADGTGQPDIAAHTGSPTLPHAEWTFGVYSAGDNNLDQDNNVPNVNEMKKVGSTNLVNVVALHDSRATNIARYLYIKRNDETVLQNLGAQNLGNPKVLTEFITFELENYPAAKHFLVFDDHGRGWDGVCDDRPIGEHLDISELREGLNNAGKTFELIGFDTCLESHLETVYEIRGSASYIVASEAQEPFTGWDYTSLLNNLTGNTHVDSKSLAKNIISIAPNPPAFNVVTLSAVNVSAIAALVNAVDNFANEALANFSANSVGLKKAVKQAQMFPSGTFPNSFRDIFNFSKQITTNTSISQAIRNKAQIISNQKNDIILANYASPIFPGAEGMHIYLPEERHLYNKNKARYEKTLFSQATNWSKFINATTGSSGIIATLTTENPGVTLSIKTSTGSEVGIDVPNDLKCSQCGSTIDAAGCIYSPGFFEISLPIAENEFNWSISASELVQNNTTFNLTIQVIENDTVTQKQKNSGIIQPNETISGVFVLAQASFNISGYKINGRDGSVIAGWNITLSNSTMQKSMLTDDTGAYKFENLASGTYNVTEEMKPGFTNITPISQFITIAVNDRMNVNFTNIPLPPQPQTFNISGYKINDTNGNGRWDAGERGISNWTIRLIGITGTGKDTKVIRKETFTNTMGFYMFDNLPAGRYNIIEKVEKGFVPTGSPVKHIKLPNDENSINNFTNRLIR